MENETTVIIIYDDNMLNNMTECDVMIIPTGDGVCAGVSNKVPQTGWLRITETCCLIVLGARKPRPRCQDG